MINSDKAANKLRIVTIVIPAVITLVYFCCFATKPFYTNDEVIMRNIANGLYNGTPDGHLVYQMYMWGAFLSVLYKIVPSVNWYDIFMLGLHFLAWFVIAEKISTFFKTKKWIIASQIVSLLSLAVIDYRYVIFHQYTDLAAILIVASILLFVTSDYAFSIILLTLSLWIRKESFLLGLPLLCLIILLKILKQRKLEKKVITYLAVVFGIILLSFTVEKIAYSSAEWASFKAYNEARTQMVDYNRFPTYEEAEDILTKYNITKEEYAFISSGSYVYSENVDTEIMEALAERAQIICKQSANAYIQAVAVGLKNEFFSALSTPQGIAILISLLLSVSFSLLNKQILDAIISTLFIVYQYIFTAYFLYKGRFPERVSHALYLVVLISLLCIVLTNVKAYFETHEKSKYDSFSLGIAIVLCVILSVSFGRERIKVSNADENEWAKYLNESEVLNEYLMENSENIYLVTSPIANYLCDRMIASNYTKMDNAIFLSYWTCDSPILANKKLQLGIENISTALLEKDNVYLIIRKDDSLEKYDNYFDSLGNKHSTVVTETISDAVGELSVIKFIKE